MSIIVSDVSYHYPNQQALIAHLGFSVSSNGKASLIGNNGTGKSTLLRLLAGELTPSSGAIQCSSQPYYIPQQTTITGKSVSEALKISEKINALHHICNGSNEQIHYDRLADDWDIESRCRSALDFWGLTGIDPAFPMDALSGGEKSKIFLAGLLIHKPDIILFDEPTNHLDRAGRDKLYDYISTVKATIITVSHDITLLNLLNTTYELSEKGIRIYGGNYSFYKEQKEMEEQALARQINSEEASLRLARKKALEVRERQEKRMSRASKDTSSGIPRIMLKGRRDSGENTGAKLSGKHTGIISEAQQNLSALRQKQRINSPLKIDFENTQLHRGKLLVEAVNINFGYPDDRFIWETPLNMEIRSGERIHITGNNGTGKTTLVKLLTGELLPSEGTIKRADFSYIYLDQQYSRTDKDVTVLELSRTYNFDNLQEHEIRSKLNRALFPQETWDKNCRTLSGGERMRLHLCCLTISNRIPDMFILDEPTNNLDISGLSILTDAVKNYRGTVLVISHDKYFTDTVGITKSIELKVREGRQSDHLDRRRPSASP
ncbi:MAG: ATP-binding cassette domain-containing protein [Tannerella sp.]|nr:ATP-binding cassette domain-containing protein [Tannerella sp.]